MADPEFVNKDNSSELANSLFNALTVGVTIPPVPDFSDPKYDITIDETTALYSDIIGATIAEVTTNDLEGTGAFDVFMSAIDKHLEREFKGDRITGSQYAEVYSSVMNQVMGQAVSFTLQKDQSRWAAVTAQMQARIAEIQATQALIELEKTKYETLKANFEMYLSGAQYGLTKMQIATEEANHDSVTADVAIKQFQRNFQMPAELAVTQYERTAVLPSTVAMNEVQVDRILPAQASISEYQNRVLQPLEADIQKLQRDSVIPLQVSMEQFKLDNLLPVELGQQQHILNFRQPAESNLIKEQMETQRGNTLDMRSDGITPISGLIGAQKRDIDAEISTKQYLLDNKLPVDIQLLTEQTSLTEMQKFLTSEQRESERANTAGTRSDGGVVGGVIEQQVRNLTLEADTKDYVLLNQLPKQVELVDKQIVLTTEQSEAERAKTLDARSDGATVTGSVGKQKDLYDQQIDSFIKDAKHKTAKMYLDGWITQKTLDEGLTAPTQLTNTNVDAVLSSVRNSNNLT